LAPSPISGALVGVLGLAVLLGLDHLLVAGFGLAVRALGLLGLGAVGLLALAFAGVVLRGLGVLWSSSPSSSSELLGGLGHLLAQVQVAQDLAGDAGEGGLVVDGGGQAVQVLAGPVLDVGAQDVDQGLGAVWRGVAGQALADHQRQDLGHRGRLAVGGDGAGQALLFEASLERGRQVGAHATQGVGADGFQTRLLDGFERRLAVGRAGAGLGVGGGVVVGQAQGHLVGQAADARGLLADSGRAADAAAPPGCRSGWGPSPENTTSRSGVSASERAAWARARLNGSVGLSGLEAMSSGLPSQDVEHKVGGNSARQGRV
jgi:hypothetical protein